MITNELRKYVWDKVPSKHLEDLIDIADAIEQKHEEELVQERAKALMMNRVSAANGFIELPKDADGKTIHLQDRMSWDNGTFNVHELNLTADGWTTWDELHGYTVRADQCRHVKPDSWEAIIEEAASYGDKRWFSGTQGDKANIAELVERCKRLAGEDA